jgi:hypothetical protein
MLRLPGAVSGGAGAIAYRTVRCNNPHLWWKLYTLFPSSLSTFPSAHPVKWHFRVVSKVQWTLVPPLPIMKEINHLEIAASAARVEVHDQFA